MAGNLGCSQLSRQVSSTPMNPSLRNVRLTFWTFALIAGILQAWSYRFFIEPDGVNYLDIASAYLRHDWAAAINGYWSPLYSWLLAAILGTVHPSAYWESTFLHLLNFISYLVALRCFEFFFRRLLVLVATRYPNTVDGQGLPEWAWWIIGYTSFLLAALRLITLGMDTPDIVLAAFLFLSTGMVVDLAHRRCSVLSYTLLGVVLATAYFAKSVMFPMSFVFMFTAAFSGASGKRPEPRVLATLAAFALVSWPFVGAISRAKGHLTFGETGKVAYLNEVKPSTIASPVVASQNSEAPAGLSRQLFTEPAVYEYGSVPLSGTFPPWYDPSYWYTGTAVPFDSVQQVRAAIRGITNYLRILSVEKEWIAGWLVLALFAGAWRETLKRWFELWFLWFPAVVMLALYALVLVEPRYVGAAMAVTWIALFCALPWRQIGATPRLGVAVVLAIAITTGAALANEQSANLAGCFHRTPHVQWLVAQRLGQMNVQLGDHVAVLGHTTVADYWAHLAGLRIVADVPLEAVTSYWTAGPEKRVAISSRLGGLGIKVLVTDLRPVVMEGWVPLGNTGYYAQILPTSNGRTHAQTETSPPDRNYEVPR
jgi:hypothetical protein